MSRVREWMRRVIGLFGRGRADADLQEELRLHAELASEAGTPPAGIARAMDALRDQRGLPWLDDLRHDLRYALRTFRRSPGFTLVAILTLAIGIGPTTAIFTIIDHVLVRPLPYPDADRLVSVWYSLPVLKISDDTVMNSPSMFFTYRDQGRAFDAFGLWQPGSAAVTGSGEPEQVRVVRATEGTLDALGVPPLVGRWFTESDDTPGTPETVILGYGYWQRRFGGDAATLGRSITVDARPRTVVGIMPRGFQVMDVAADLVLPERFDRSQVFLGNFSYRSVARLKQGVSRDAAVADMARLIPIWKDAWPSSPAAGGAPVNWDPIPSIHPVKADIVGDIGRVLWLLAGTIGLVLVLVCANVASLLLVRADGRRSELALRAALGAGRGRIARALVAESLALGVLGGALGVVLALMAGRLLTSLGPTAVPRMDEVHFDVAGLAFALGVSLVVSLLFGLAPILRYAGPYVARELGGSRGASRSRERRRARRALVVVQIALALVLVVGSGLMLRTFGALRAVVPGFTDPEHVQLARIVVPPAQIPTAEAVTRMEQGVLERLALLPGVSASALADSAPMDGNISGDTIVAESQTEVQPTVRRFKFISPGYFGAIGASLVAGRDFTWTDLYDRRRVAIVSDALARELWGNSTAALGRRIHEAGAANWREIVGVAPDIHDEGVDRPARPTIYWPALMSDFWGRQEYAQRGATLVVRTNRAATESFLAEMRSAIWVGDPDVPVAGVQTLDDLYQHSTGRTWFTLVLLAIAGVMALALGIVGIYGVVSYGVAQRQREIGIRMALGAEPGGVRRLFLRDGLAVALIGVGIGTLVALALTRVMASLLFGVSPLDPATFGASAVLVVIAAALASYLPARRSTRVDPASALRAE